MQEKRPKPSDDKPAKKRRALAQPTKGPAPPRPPLPPHRLVLAPMVGGSELPFRLLARRYGAELCYTPMIYSERFVGDAAYRAAELRTCAEDAPLVAHFCGNDASTLLAAAKLAEPHVVAVDLNLGCPQRVAHSGHFGSYLLGESDRPLLLGLVRTLAKNLRVPVFCKIRLLDTPDATLALCRQLVDAGAALLAVHARYRGSATRRRDGPAMLEQVAAIKEADLGVPILANGNVRAAADVTASLKLTGADGVMSAEGMLDEPSLFFGAADGVWRERRRLKKKLKEAKALQQDAAAGRALSAAEQATAAGLAPARAALRALPPIDGCVAALAEAAKEGGGAAGALAARRAAAADRLGLALEYLSLVEATPEAAPLPTVIFHLRRMCRARLEQYQLLASLVGAQSVAAARRIVEKCARYASGDEKFVFDEAAAKREAEAEARRKVERRKRQEYEARMTRKAKREGKPVDTYLREGLAPPSAADVAAAKAMEGRPRMEWWRARFGQHCLTFHMEGGCARAQGCAFLHAEVRGGADPDWLQEETEVRERGGAAVAEKVALSLDGGGGGGAEKPPCADFRKGRCRRGDGCKYSHAVVK